MRRTLCTTLAAAALAFAACGDDDGGDSGESAKAGEPYPQEVRDNFLTSCDEQPNAPRSVCECSLEKIEEKYSIEEFERIDKAQREGEPLPNDIQTMVEDCVEQET